MIMTESSEQVKGNSKQQLVALAVVLVCLLGLALTYAKLQHSNAAEEVGLTVQGNLKMEETNINTKVAGTVQQVLVREGDTVAAGDPLAIIDSDALLAKRTQAEAVLAEANGQYQAALAAQAAAESQYQKAVNGARSQELTQAQASYELAQRSLERIQTLYDEGAVSYHEYDQAQTQYQVAAAKYELAQQGAREEDILATRAQAAQAAAAAETARGLITQAQGGLDEVNSYLADTKITAPTAGVVSSVNINPGELVSTGMPLMSIIDRSDPWVEVNVKETELAQVRSGAAVTLRIAAFPDAVYHGVITNVNQKANFATKRATNNNGEFDILSYGVKVEFTDLDREVFAGMTVWVDFSDAE